MKHFKTEMRKSPPSNVKATEEICAISLYSKVLKSVFCIQ
jgi:hypothetical protein